jgi:hypothetical protein
MKRLHIRTVLIGLLLVGSPALADPITDWIFGVTGGSGDVVGKGSGYPYPSGGPPGLGGWYNYPSGWGTQWFYNEPYDPERSSTIHVEGQMAPLSDDQPTYLLMAVNYSTPAWSLEGNPPGDPRVPPLPGVDESLYIARVPFEEHYWLPTDPVAFSFDYVIPDYNPEWVSFDLLGYNFWVQGTIIHECVPEPAAAGLLALGALALVRRRI